MRIGETTQSNGHQLGIGRRSVSYACWAVFCFMFFLAHPPIPDLWGHVRFGQDLWQTGRIVREDIYSYLTGDQVWINHEWLSEAIFYFAFAAAGSVGLIAFKSGLAFLIVAFLYWHLRQ
jgi:hypothetical protein